MFKQVLLVEEQNNRGFNEPFIVANGVKEFHGLHHTVHFLVLRKDKVVTAQGHAKNNGRYPFETMNPLFSLGSLTAHVEHFKVEAFVGELGLDDTRRFDSSP